MKNVVLIPKEASYDLSKLESIIKTIGGKGGCQACCSGDPIEFRIEEMAMSAEKLDEKVYRFNSETGNIEDVK